MRLIRLGDQPIRVEGKYGAVVIEAHQLYTSVKTLPDTECQSRIPRRDMLGDAGILLEDIEGHTVILEKR